MPAQLEKPKFDKRQWQAQDARKRHAEASDIGSIPSVVNQERKDKGRDSLEFFLQTYFPQSTGLSPFSQDHKNVISLLEACILRGGRFCNAVYRGFAKTTIATNAAIWAAVYGHRRYVVVFSANEPQAQDLISSVKMELSENDLLLEDFPEVCHAVRALEGKAQRCHSQTFEGQLTHISWRADRVILPAVPGSKASGCIIASRGMTGSGTRGLVHKTPEGTNQRPDFVIVDDPQTEESASTPLQVSKRLDILKRSILRLGGHNSQMACVVNATVIAVDDVVEQLLDPKRNPSWQGMRIKMVKAWSDHHDTMWLGEYARRRTSFRSDDPDDRRRAIAEANEYYLANRAAMDAGCVVSWEHCYDHDAEYSAIQHAYNMLIDDGADIFGSEAQNEPKIASLAGAHKLTASEIITRLNGFERYRFPAAVEFLTAFIDVQGTALYYLVAAWERDFTGYVVDYGAWPEQRRRYYRLSDLNPTLGSVYKGAPFESQIYQGMQALTAELHNREWIRADNARLRIGKIIIDANWGESTKTVKRFCQVSPHAAILTPAHGRAMKAGDMPMSEWNVKPGEHKGTNWLVRPDREGGGLRHVTYDGNYWKSFIQSRLSLMAPSRSSLSLWGSDPRQHEMIADHLAAESPIRTKGRNREVDEWSLPAHKPDNHLLDCLVGCCVGASMLGVAMEEQTAAKITRKRISLAEAKRRAQGR